MPNWCSNYVEITGPAEAIDRLLEKVGQPYELTVQGLITKEDGSREFGPTTVTRTGKVLLFNIIRPDESEMESYGNEGWYDWNITHWGTKWEIDVYEIIRTKNETNCDTVTFYFDSAWSPPVYAFGKLAEQYPEVSIQLEYAEPSMDFGGTCAWENGEQTEDDSAIPEDFEHLWSDPEDEEE